MTPLTVEKFPVVDLANIDGRAGQNLLRVVRAALHAGRLKSPRGSPSPVLAQRLQEYRQEFGDECDVHVLATKPDSISVLVAPRDNGPLFVLTFSAMESIASNDLPQ